jgi:bifunctional DNA-binding transcriptional regulator/antitoxin component of YhaV-PrlF toxin-antitoxin module
MKLLATLSERGRVSIPKALCQRLSWKPGQEPAFIPKGAGVLIIAAPERQELVGIARGANTDDYRDRNDRV